MKLNELKPPQNSRKKKFRLGKGDGSGKGKTSGHGMNGQKCRSGASIPNWFEGGQTPIHRRLPIKGFNNSKFSKKYRIVSLNTLAGIDESIIDIELMEKYGFLMYHAHFHGYNRYRYLPRVPCENQHHRQVQGDADLYL